MSARLDLTAAIMAHKLPLGLSWVTIASVLGTAIPAPKPVLLRC